MKNTFKLIQVLDNLSRIPRSGGVLFAGLNSQNGDSLAEHSYKVAWLCLLFSSKLKKDEKEINEGLLLKYAITHDWVEAVLLDVPTGSPSYGSYFDDVNIREVMKTAEKKVLATVETFVQNEITLDLANLSLNELELAIFKSADISAILIEILEWRYQGYKYEWFDYIWANTFKRLEDLVNEIIPQLKDILPELQDAYDKNNKEANPFLTKPEFQKLKK